MNDLPESSPPDETTPDEPAARAPASEEPNYWGPWQALVLVGVTLLFTEVVVYALTTEAVLALPNLFPELIGRPSPLDPWLRDGGLLAILALVKAPVGVALVALYAWSRTRRARRYLALRDAPLRTLALWFGLLIPLIVLLDALRWFTGQPIVPEWLKSVYLTSPSLPLLLVAIVVAAPLFEEILFRGFLLPSLIHTRLGATGGILLTAGLFALVHYHYTAFDLATVFVLGAFLGVARWRSGSTAVSVVLHAMVNAVALAETALLVS